MEETGDEVTQARMLRVRREVVGGSLSSVLGVFLLS